MEGTGKLGGLFTKMVPFFFFLLFFRSILKFLVSILAHVVCFICHYCLHLVLRKYLTFLENELFGL